MSASPHPVWLLVEDDLRRSRLTVFFRLLLAIPHVIWVTLWSIAVFFVAIANWLFALAAGRPAARLHRFLVRYVRYSLHLDAYLSILANPYPEFTGEESKLGAAYPIDVELPGPAPQSRWGVLLRVVLALPALFLSTFLGGALPGIPWYTPKNSAAAKYNSGADLGALLGICALLGWFASVAQGRMPRGLRDAGAYSVGYRAQVLAYLLLITDRYPSADPAAMLAALEPPPLHSVRIESTDDLRRSRMTVFFRLPIAIPHLVWLELWGIAAFLAAIVNWFVTLFAGRPASALHRFLSAYVRYGAHVTAFLSLVANPFPGFTGARGRYPVDIELPPRGAQRRLVTFFRLILAIPAWLVSTVLFSVLLAAAILMWFVALLRGRVPVGLRDLGLYAVRYAAQTNAYVYLLTEQYPHASPLEGRAAPQEAEPRWTLEPVV